MRNKQTLKRAKSILDRDKMMIPDNYLALLTSEINVLLAQYMDLDSVGAKIKLNLTVDGVYELKVVALANRIKDVPVCIPSFE